MAGPQNIHLREIDCTTIISDEWKAYSNIRTWRARDNPHVRYVHNTVCHKRRFVDPITGAHTQLIESCCGHVKCKIVRQINARYFWRFVSQSFG